MSISFFLRNLVQQNEFHIEDQSGRVSPSSKSINLTHSSLCNKSCPPTTAPPWISLPLFLTLSIRRSSSEAVILFLQGQTFLGIFAASCLHTWRNCESLSWVMCVYPPRAPEVTPSCQQRGGQHFACGNFQSGRAWSVATLPALPFSNLAPLWLRRELKRCMGGVCRAGWAGGGEVWGFVGRALQCFQKHRLLAASLNVMEKNAWC